MAGKKINDLTALGRDLASTDLLELSLAGGTGSRKITGQQIINAIPSGITIGTTAITSGTVGRVLFEGTGNVVQESANLFWNNTNNRLGIGTSSPSHKLHVLGGITDSFKVESAGANLFNQFVSTDGTGEFGIFNDAFYFQPLSTLANGLRFLNGANAVVLQMSQTGNVLINTTTDAGFKLDVNGTARVSGQATIAGTTNASAGIGRNTLINGTITATANSNVLVGLDIEPTFNTGAFTGVETLALRVTGFISNFTSSGATQLRIIGPSGSNKSLFFFNSSTTFASTRIYNQGTTNHLIFATGDSLSNPTDRFTIFASTGNVAINTTTDAGFKLDVNGTARVVTKVVTPILEGVSSGRVDLKYGFGTSTPSTNILSVGYGGEPAILIGSGTTQNSSMIQMNSTTQGFLPPRMTTTQVNAISLPAEGLVVYNTTISHLCVYQAGAWVKINHSPM